MPAESGGRQDGSDAELRRESSVGIGAACWPPDLALRAGYDHFRLERQGALVSRKTLEYYDLMVLPFLNWLGDEGVERFDHLQVAHARQYRAQLAATPGGHGRLRQPKTLLESHRAIGAFLRWAQREGYEFDGRVLGLQAPRVPEKEPTASDQNVHSPSIRQNSPIA